ncbi:High-molecular-weight cytochrome c [Candidatus Desulfarcum epimagneticum]|uniref:High-molecular-weight cytochrome c n=1 Tax=uncultured Desulfobacteraceae bacterium TaxID=218296 RepID=A0A484HDT2_9BACT|nr:High-molecular-weight cytochrome c [uncultured Desulfobacteraceae bacterium]
MTKKKYFFARAAILFLAGIVMIFPPAIGGAEKAPVSSAPRSGNMTMDSMDVFGPPERPRVMFPHDAHVRALEKKGGDCSACHMSEGGKFSIHFKRTADLDKKALVEIYHRECALCHRQTAVTREKTGPTTCGGCHDAKKTAPSFENPVEFDKRIHFRHTSSLEKDSDPTCGRCHHEYDEKKKALFYARGKEGSCRYCHKEKREDNRSSMREAAHVSCVGCHAQTLSQKKKTGPVLCGQCHSAEWAEQVSRPSLVTRMKMKQPDAVFIKKTAEGQKLAKTPRMGRVPFDHENHEAYNDTCRVCHHASLDSCVECHSLKGSEKGRGVRLEQAMHRTGAAQSCVGCHEAVKHTKDCGGCHWEIPSSPQENPDSCKACHMEPVAESGAGGKAGELKGVSARKVLDQVKREGHHEFKKDEIPEKVRIDSMSDEYEPVDMPHGKIILKLSENIKNNKLALYFHRDKTTLCQGCHHNSPPSQKPPGCAECHGKPFDEKDISKPGLKAAYHMQCMECHRIMDIQKPASTDCLGCHDEKKSKK